MPRTDRSRERKAEFSPIIARAFADQGYRRTTTAALAEACGVQETTLYRLWPNKKAMFIAAIEHVYDVSTATWDRLLADADESETAAERLLAYESTHHGEFGLYRIVFAGLSESDDDDIRDALNRMYRRYHEFIARRLTEHREARGASTAGPVETSAWALLGLGAITSIGLELGLFGGDVREALWREAGRLLVDGEPE